jgi:peptide/nickel transport system substrate-binding protein
MSSTPRGGRRLRRALVAGFAAAAACALMATPAVADPSSSPSTPADGAASAPAHTASTFVIGLKQDIDSLNPYDGVLASAFDAYQMMYDYLTDVSPKDMTPVPSLATSWETSADGKTWTFHIRHGVKWSDGQDLTADDVVFSYERVLAPDSTENGQYGSGLENVTKVTAADPYTVVFTTSAPSATLLASTQSGGVPIVPKHIWSSISESKVADFANDQNPVGSGPFRMVEARKGQFYRFLANKTYWNGAPHVNEIDFRIYAGEETMTEALKKGDIDFAEDLSSNAYAGLKGENNPDIALNHGPSTYTYELGFNNGAATVDNKPIGDGNPALKNVLVRQAIDYAIDKQTIVNKVLLGYGTPAYGEISTLYPIWHWEATGAEKRTFDPNKAKALLDQAGYPMGPNGVRVGPNGKPLALRLFGRADSPESKTEVQYIKEWLTGIGIKISDQIMSEDALTDIIGKGNYDLFQWDWGFGPDPDATLSVFACDARSTEDKGAISAGWSDSYYCNPQFEALYKQQKSIINEQQRRTVVQAAVKNLYDNAVYSVLYYGDTLEAYRSDRFTGFVKQPTTGGPVSSQLGTWSYRSITPVTGQKPAKSKFPMILGVAGGAVLLVIIGGVVMVTRRRSTADERE